MTFWGNPCVNPTWYSIHTRMLFFLMNTYISSGFYCSVLLNSNPSYGKFIQVYTFYYLIHSYWAHPLKNFIQRLQILLLGRLFAITLKLVLTKIQSIRREKYWIKQNKHSATMFLPCKFIKGKFDLFFFLSIKAFLVKKMVPQKSSQLQTFARWICMTKIT